MNTKENFFVEQVQNKTKKIIDGIKESIESESNEKRKEKLRFLVSHLEREPLNLIISIAGEYDTGKSSLIKALTGADLKIDADVTTSTPFAVRYNDSITFMDMPGILSGKNEHDEIARKTILESDLVLFVITNELFNSESIPYFKSLIEIYHKQDQILLIINQIDRVNTRKKSIEDAIDIMTEALREQIAPIPLDHFTPSFVSARDCLDSLVENEPSASAILKKQSRIDGLVENLNSFFKNKGPRAKLARPLQQILGSIEEMRKLIISGKPENEIVHEYLSRKISILTKLKTDWETSANNIAEDARHDIQQLAEPVLKSIDKRSPPEEINQLWEEADEKVDQVRIKYEDKIKIVASDIISKAQAQINDLETSPIGIEIEDLINISEINMNPNKNIHSESGVLSSTLKKAIKSGIEGTGKHLAKNSIEAGNTVVKIAKNFGAKFKPWGKIKLAGNASKVLGKVGKALGPIALGFEIYMNYREEKAKEGIETKRREIKADIRKSFSTYGTSLHNAIKDSSKEFSETIFLFELQSAYSQRSEINSSTETDNKILSSLNDFEAQTLTVLSMFDTTGSCKDN